MLSASRRLFALTVLTATLGLTTLTGCPHRPAPPPPITPAEPSPPDGPTEPTPPSGPTEPVPPEDPVPTPFPGPPGAPPIPQK